jgi:hypothetical protein
MVGDKLPVAASPRYEPGRFATQSRTRYSFHFFHFVLASQAGADKVSTTASETTLSKAMQP